MKPKPSSDRWSSGDQRRNRLLTISPYIADQVRQSSRSARPPADCQSYGSVCDTCFGSYVLEFSVAQIAIERIARRWFAVGQVGSVGEKQVGLAVVVEIDHAHPGAEGLEHVLLGRGPRFRGER